MPIESFRPARPPDARPEGVRRFRSSGTTAGGDLRSAADFSAAGIAAYREGALAAFAAMLTQLGVGAEVPGISLIPPVTDWPESSLAQMVAWIAEERVVRYVESVPPDLATPVWVFGTAFHFVNSIDAGLGTKLPPGSLIIETGGTKGKSRSVERGALYEDLERVFGVPLERIVSEYGMCELASQAYDWGRLEERVFRFPTWVETGVATGPGVVEATGIGLLVVGDPKRIDVLGAAIRTEDMAEVFADGSFRLLGRARGAPLKGCSLLAEEIVAKRSTRIVAARPRTRSTGVSVRARVEGFFAAEAESLLAQELGSRDLARATVEDVRASLPTSDAAWSEAAARAVGSSAPQRWLFVLPRSHSIAGLHPIAMGVAAGLDVTVRQTPSIFLEAYLALFPEVARLDTAFRIASPADVERFDAILAFGSDETIAAIEAASGKPVVGFGERAGVALLSAAETQDPAVAVQLARDAFSLSQAGCVSTRLAVVIGESADAPALARNLGAATRALHGWPSLPLDVRLGMEIERARFERLGFELILPQEPGAPLVAVTRTPCREMLARRAYCLPLFLPQNASLSFMSTIGTLTASPQTLGAAKREGLSFRPLGAAHAISWNGAHEGRPLFS